MFNHNMMNGINISYPRVPSCKEGIAAAALSIFSMFYCSSCSNKMNKFHVYTAMSNMTIIRDAKKGNN